MAVRILFSDMPVYDYDCPKCGNSFELRKGWHDDMEAKCAQCGAVAQKRFASPTVIYKGGGFYTTDYGRKSSGGSAPSKANSSNDKTSAEKPAKADGKSQKTETTSTKNQSAE